jgi:hypothetical protein
MTPRQFDIATVSTPSYHYSKYSKWSTPFAIEYHITTRVFRYDSVGAAAGCEIAQVGARFLMKPVFLA